MAFKATAAASAAARRLTNDPDQYHKGIKSPFFEKLRKAIVANPSINNGLIDVRKMRNPPPGGRPEVYAKEASKASDIAENPYFKRDARRAYPRYQPVSQSYLAQLLLASPERAEQMGLPSPTISESAATALTKEGAAAPSLAALYADGTQPKFGAGKLPPTPPTRYKHKWTLGEQTPVPEGTYWPMINYK